MATVYLAHPQGTHQGAWRGVVNSYPDGYRIHYYACCLAEIAAESKANGILRLNCGAGAPMAPEDIAARLGCDFGWLMNVLFPALQHLGEGYAEGVGWHCTSPMFTAHTLGWQGGEKGGQKALPAPQKSQVKVGRKSNFSGLDPAKPGYDAIYKKWLRTCQLPAGVELAGPCAKFLRGPDGGCLILSGKVEKCPHCPEIVRKRPEMSGNIKRTKEPENAENISFSECPKIDKEKEVKTKEETAAEAEKKPAAVSSASPLLTPNPLENQLLKKALESLPLALQKDARDICRSEPAGDCVKISNIKLLADRLSSSTGTPIPNPGAWLRGAVREDYASSTRQQSVAAQDAKEGALRRLAALEKEQERLSQQLAQEGYTPETAETAEFLLALLA